MAARLTIRPPLLLVFGLLVRLTTAAPACVQTLGTEGHAATCAGDVPLTLPTGLRMLKLTNMTMTVLEKGHFSHLPNLAVLDLSGNGLIRLASDAFAELLHLKRLNIAHNRLCFGDEAFPADAFHNVTSLRTLIMHSNICPSGHVGYPDRALGELSGLDTLAMNGLPNVPLGPGFAKMTSLKSLELSGKYCNLGDVSNETFASLTNTSVSQLSLRACNVSKLAYNSFEPLSHLTSLNLACNERIGIDGATEAIKGSSTNSLDTVILDDVSNTTVILSKRLFGSHHFKTVRRLSLRANDIVGVDVRMMHLVPALRTVTTGFNSIYDHTSLYHLKNFQESTADTHLEVIDASHLRATRFEYRRLFCAQDHVNFDDYFREKPRLPNVTYTHPTRPSPAKQNRTSLIPVSLQVVFLDQSRYHADTKVTDYSDMVVLNMSYTQADVLKGPMSGFRNLQVFDARNCRIYQIYSGALGVMGLLKYLYLQHNVIGDRGHEITDQFHGLHSLLELDLSYNKIPSIGRDAFRDLTHIRKLNLHGNRLTVLGFGVANMASGVSIDMGDNLLAYADSAFVNDAAAVGSKTEMDLTGNSFVCNCSSAVFVRWVQTTAVTLTDKKNLTCLNGTGHVVNIVAIDARHVPASCPSGMGVRGHYIGIILGCLFLAIVLVFAVVVALRCQRRRRDGNSKVAYRLFDGKLSM